ncbi:MAG: hypothetical protein WC665_05620 [Sulfurimonas sp.]|jgi:hypothetical protein
MANLIQHQYFNVQGKNLDFVDVMVAGGISDDCSPMTGDVSFDDNEDYDQLTVSNEKLYAIAKRLNLKTVSYI